MFLSSGMSDGVTGWVVPNILNIHVAVTLLWGIPDVTFHKDENPIMKTYKCRFVWRKGLMDCAWPKTSLGGENQNAFVRIWTATYLSCLTLLGENTVLDFSATVRIQDRCTLLDTDFAA